MLYRVAKEILAYLRDEYDLDVYYEDEREYNVVGARFKTVHGEPYQIRITVRDNSGACTVATTPLEFEDTSDRLRLLETIDDCNARIRRARCILTKYNGLTIRYDWPACVENPAATAVEVMIDMITTINELSPLLHKPTHR